jgi:methionyl-tRNA synthetase
MLHFSGRKTPNKVNVHGFLTVNNGEKMSKSRGTGLDPLKYLSLGMNPEWLRYYLAAKLSARNEDIDFNAEDFMARVNSDLIGKFINIASRSAGFIAKRFDGKLGSVSADGQELLAALQSATPAIAAFYEEREYAKALREVMLLADKVNAYVDQNKPWELAKQEGQEARLHDACTACIEAFRLLSLQLKPVLPALAGGPAANVSVFAGRIADAGVDPLPLMIATVEKLKAHPQIELIWASPREVFNLVQADRIGCQIITMTNDLIKKIPLIGKDLSDYSLDTVKMFYRDAQAAGFKV